MITSNKGISFIKTFEGLRLASYQDSGGVWTIGYGHTNGVKPGQTISDEQAIIFLKQDLARFEKYVMAYDSIYHFTQSQFDALVSFCYNAGPGNLSKRLLDYGKKPLERVKMDLPTTCVKAKGKVLAGLQRRRKAEAELMGDCRKDIPSVAAEVIQGYWGRGKERQSLLEAAGYTYRTVQDAVNSMLKEN